ncbi:3-methyl-2-oxobutanoate hydroxymethyltransferase [Aliamphritea spongicola]|uniref:3-methyl-2-oxobutanoate hydroxymethyltransferase n=1 Tax=Aliamphritea spongicola TaxID=707589 RepID=UPI00196BAB72|nr:3-methyl-2-oxobutanoate hydroxymethyltransferase [Aliamphritea spongicola]MBN3563793.1 3-methyl-2-oxobutanoate hydroxymethyltransferase [Aliamphritea spongicola]
MKKIYTYGGEFGLRNWTAADLTAHKGGAKLTQVTAVNAEEAAAAEAAGIDMISIIADDLAVTRAAAPHTFITAALQLTDYYQEEAVINGAFKAMEGGADAVYTIRNLEMVSKLASFDMPVMGHAGLIPRKSTWIGGLRAFGRTAEEAMELYRQFKRLEDAGAWAVEVEVVPTEVLAAINMKTKLVTTSIGAGSGGDVMFLFTDDIVGETENPPRHVRSYRNFFEIREQMRRERIAALKEFRADVEEGAFPGIAESVEMNAVELDKFLEELDKQP